MVGRIFYQVRYLQLDPYNGTLHRNVRQQLPPLYTPVTPDLLFDESRKVLPFSRVSCGGWGAHVELYAGAGTPASGHTMIT